MAMTSLNAVFVRDYCLKNYTLRSSVVRGVDVPALVIKSLLRVGQRHTDETRSFLPEVERIIHEELGTPRIKVGVGELVYQGGTALAVLAWLKRDGHPLLWNGSLAIEGEALYIQPSGAPSLSPDPASIRKFDIPKLVVLREKKTIQQMADDIGISMTLMTRIFKLLSDNGWAIRTPIEALEPEDINLDATTQSGSYFLGLIYGGIYKTEGIGYTICSQENAGLELMNKTLFLNGYIALDDNTYRLNIHNRQGIIQMDSYIEQHDIPVNDYYAVRLPPLQPFNFKGFFTAWYEQHGWTGKSISRNSERRYLCICGGKEMLELFSLELHKALRVRHRSVRPANKKKELNVFILDYSTRDTDKIKEYLGIR